MTRAKAPQDRRVPGPKTPHVGEKLQFLDDATKAYSDKKGGTRSEKSRFLKQEASRWASTFGFGVAFDTQLDVYDPNAGSELSPDEKANWLEDYRSVSATLDWAMTSRALTYLCHSVYTATFIIA
jgi:hypothetical protein